MNRHQGLPGRTPVGLRQHDRQFGNSGGLKQGRQGQLFSENEFQLKEQLSGFQRMSSQIEEIFVDPDVLRPQYLLPQRRQLHFDGIARAGLPSRRSAVDRRRQRPHVDFLVRRQRESIEKHEERRHHIVRQYTTQEPPQLLSLRALPILRNRISGQLLQAQPILAGRHHHLLELRMPAEDRLDFAQFDAEPADLDLLIDAAKMHDFAVLAVPRQITRPIQFRLGVG